MLALKGWWNCSTLIFMHEDCKNPSVSHIFFISMFICNLIFAVWLQNSQCNAGILPLFLKDGNGAFAWCRFTALISVQKWHCQKSAILPLYFSGTIWPCFEDCKWMVNCSSLPYTMVSESMVFQMLLKYSFHISQHWTCWLGLLAVQQHLETQKDTFQRSYLPISSLL